jgi:hypothetical protein
VVLVADMRRRWVKNLESARENIGVGISAYADRERMQARRQSPAAPDSELPVQQQISRLAPERNARREPHTMRRLGIRFMREDGGVDNHRRYEAE